MAITLPKSLEDVAANQEFKVAPPAQYTFEVKSAKEGMSQNNNVKVDFRFSIIDDDEYNDVSVFETVTITEQALFRLKQLALATGVEIDGEFDPEDFIGETFDAVIDVEQTQNKEGEKQFNEDGSPKQRNIIKNYVFEE